MLVQNEETRYCKEDNNTKHIFTLKSFIPIFILQFNLYEQFRNSEVYGKDTRITEDTGVRL